MDFVSSHKLPKLALGYSYSSTPHPPLTKKETKDTCTLCWLVTTFHLCTPWHLERRFYASRCVAAVKWWTHVAFGQSVQVRNIKVQLLLFCTFLYVPYLLGKVREVIVTATGVNVTKLFFDLAKIKKCKIVFCNPNLHNVRFR